MFIIAFQKFLFLFYSALEQGPSRAPRPTCNGCPRFQCVTEPWSVRRGPWCWLFGRFYTRLQQASSFPHVDARGRVSARSFVDGKSLVEICEGFTCRKEVGDFREAEGSPGLTNNSHKG